VLGLLLAGLVFKGESCIIEQRTINAILGDSVPAEWDTRGFTEATDSDTVDVDIAADVIEAILEAEIDVANINSIAIAGGGYEVTRNEGHDSRRVGQVTQNGLLLLSFDVPNNQVGTSGTAGDGTLVLESTGLANLNSALNTLLEDLKDDAEGNGLGNAPDPVLMRTFIAEWTSTNPPSQGDPDDFSWTTFINLQVNYEIEVDVPNP
jgi:hypothetical protein